MDWSGWAVFGFLATVVLTGIMVAGHLLGLSRLDIPLILGSIVVRDPDRARLVGLVAHLVIGQAFALGYALGFAVLGRSGLWLGALFGVIHGLAVLTLVVPFLPAMHPRMASERTGPEFEVGLEPPGPLGMNYGPATPAVVVAAHLVYGIMLGLLLGPG